MGSWGTPGTNGSLGRADGSSGSLGRTDGMAGSVGNTVGIMGPPRRPRAATQSVALLIIQAMSITHTRNKRETIFETGNDRANKLTREGFKSGN